MNLVIKVEKPRNFHVAFQSAKSDALKNGITFEGNERSGRASGFGFEGSYTVGSDCIEIKVEKKPFLVSESRIKKEIEKYCNGL
jgi:hypothetical protein